MKNYKPIFNQSHNPEKYQELVYDRRKCRMIAIKKDNLPTPYLI
ncbi:hypothetical protein ADIWIN_2497 [Winogradskyella psychrotolerans RS-3]|uniref:Uncharacterized protein n=1 Tax=Winogradskyella psychrotolerans RS-3 TaxID=641526 RepID=S7VSJ1_9FLAO|nr:hypothetical protein ADIWIN_2497 [Winogradskyella psychrotolerans RS-3]